MVFGLTQIIMMGEFIRQIWVNEDVNQTGTQFSVREIVDEKRIQNFIHSSCVKKKGTLKTGMKATFALWL